MSAGDVERLAEMLDARYAVYRPDTETVARAILASDWLAAHDAGVAAAARREGAAVVESFRRQNPMNGDGSNYTIDQILTRLVGSEERDRLKAEHQQRWNDEYVEMRARLGRVAAAPHEEQP